MYRFARHIKYALPIKPLIIFAIMIFVILLPIICWNLEHSAYFFEGDLNHAAYLKRLSNNRRIAEARSYLNILYQRKLLPFNYHEWAFKSQSVKYNSNHINIYPKITIIVMAANRDTHKVDAYEPKYLTQTIHSLLESIDNDISKYGLRWDNISVSMCSVDKDPNRFFEFKTLSKYVEYFQLNNSKSSMLNEKCNSKLHFISCVDQALQNFKHVDKFIIMEDDLLAVEDTFHGIGSIFHSLKARFEWSQIPSRLGYVQLFYPHNQVKFSFWDSGSWLELLLISSSMVAFLLVIYFRFHFRSLFMAYNIILLVVLLLLCITIAIMIGRPHWRAAYHRIHKNYAVIEPIIKSSAAVFMDKDYMVELVSEFRNVTPVCGEDDSKLKYMETVARKANRRILSMNINLFKHVGLYSAFKKTIINPYHID